MSAVVEDLLRLAWEANAAGRPGMRDALLTLVVAESGADDAVLAERCRRLLVAHRPDHCFAASATLGHALSRPRVIGALGKLRLMYPPVRVRHLLRRAEAARGAFTGHSLPLARVLEDLSLDRAVAPAAAGRARRREADPAQALPFPGSGVPGAGAAAGLSRAASRDPDGELALFYLSVLIAIAVLLDGILRRPASDTKAA